MSKLLHIVVDVCVKCPCCQYTNNKHWCTRGFHKTLTDDQVYYNIPGWCQLPDAEDDDE